MPHKLRWIKFLSVLQRVYAFLTYLCCPKFIDSLTKSRHVTLLGRAGINNEARNEFYTSAAAQGIKVWQTLHPLHLELSFIRRCLRYRRWIDRWSLRIQLSFRGTSLTSSSIPPASFLFQSDAVLTVIFLCPYRGGKLHNKTYVAFRTTFL